MQKQQNNAITADSPLPIRQQKGVIVCPQCSGAGAGYRLNADGSPYLVRGNPVREPCPYCDGAGRVLQVTTVEHLRIPTGTIDVEEGNKNERKGGFVNAVRKFISGGN